MRPVVVAGVGMTKFGRFYDRTIKSLGAEAITEALRDAGVERDDVQAVFFANAVAGLVTGQECIRGETVLHPMGFGALPVSNVENACASGGNALHLAWASVAGGQYDTVLAVGVEKMCLEDRERMFGAFTGGVDLDEYDFPEEAGRTRSPFVDRYARVGMKLLDQGLTREDFAAVAAKAYARGVHNPRAQRTVGHTQETVLSAREVVPPLTVLMCSPVTDGAAAAVLTARASASAGGGGGPRVEIRGSALRSLPAHPVGAGDCHAASAAAAYEAAGIGPGDLDLAELHDATVVGEISNWVNTGLCQAGEEAGWIRGGGWGMERVNPSGGLLSRGHPVGATGLAQAYEVVQQLRGTAGGRQVSGQPRTALSQCGGGLIDGTTAVSAAHIFVA
jgi:acetyl-CoA acetyltransferase